MKVICVDNKPTSSWTKPVALNLGGVYEVVGKEEGEFRVLDDDGEYRYYLETRFCVSEFRNMKLEELGIWVYI